MNYANLQANAERTRTVFPEGKNVLQNKKHALAGCFICRSMGQIVWPPKYANCGQFRPPNDIWGHLCPNYLKTLFLQHLFAVFGQQKMQLLVIGPPNDFGGHLEQTVCYRFYGKLVFVAGFGSFG